MKTSSVGKALATAAAIAFLALGAWLMDMAIYAGCKLLYFLLTI